LSDTASHPVIRADKLTKTYVTAPALKAVSFDVCAGESVAILGANGAGKTTLFNLLLGLLAPDVPPDGGSCTVLGVPGDRLTPETKARIGFIADHAGSIPWATVKDLARLNRGLYPGWDQERYLRLVGDWDIDAGRRMNALSKGQKRLAEFALTLSHHPDLLVLDEPFNGLDAVMRIRVQSLLRQMQKHDGTTILYATHILSEVTEVGDRMIVLRKGEIVTDVRLADLRESVEQCFVRLYGLADAAAS
jgi:ABC-2 type transport system ATP-binding protein